MIDLWQDVQQSLFFVIGEVTHSAIVFLLEFDLPERVGGNFLVLESHHVSGFQSAEVSVDRGGASPAGFLPLSVGWQAVLRQFQPSVFNVILNNSICRSCLKMLF